MKMIKIQYKKEDALKEYTIAVLNSSDQYIEGICTNDFTEEEKKAFEKIRLEYEEKLNPYFKKGFKKFTRAKIIKLES